MADLVTFANDLVESAQEMPGEFVDVANDPLSAVFILFGVLFVGAASAVMGYLSLGAFLSLFTLDRS
jgi:hypothetical protein